MWSSSASNQCSEAYSSTMLLAVSPSREKDKNTLLQQKFSSRGADHLCQLSHPEMVSLFNGKSIIVEEEMRVIGNTLNAPGICHPFWLMTPPNLDHRRPKPDGSRKCAEGGQDHRAQGERQAQTLSSAAWSSWSISWTTTRLGLGKITKKLIKIKDQDHTVVKIKIKITGKIIFNDLRSMTRSRSFLKNTVVKPHVWTCNRIFVNLDIAGFFRFYGYFIC